MRNYILLALIIVLTSCTEKEAESIFKTESYATIKINQEKLLNDSIKVTISHISIIPDEYFKAKYILKQNSDFLHIPTDRPSQAEIIINGFSQNIWVSPDDTTAINLSSTGTIKNFSGKFTSENHYYHAKKKDKGYLSIVAPFNQLLRSLSSHEEIKNAIDSLSKMQLNYLQNYSAELPTAFKKQEEMQIVYNAAFLKVQFPLFNQAMNIIEGPLPEDFYDFAKDLELNNTDAIPINSYFEFLTNYFWKDIEQSKLKTLQGKERTIYLKNHVLDDANEYLNTEIKDYFLAHHLTDVIKHYDTAELDSIADKWQISINKALVTKIVDQKAISNEVYEKDSKVDDFEMYNLSGDTFHLRDFEDKVVYLNFWATWCKPCIANIPQLNTTIQRYHKNENIVFINLAIDSDEEKWKESVQKFNLKGLNLFIPKGEQLERIRSKFGITGLPHYVILGKENSLKVNYANKAPIVKSELDALLNSNN